MRVLFAPETFNLGETSRGVEIAKAMRKDGHETLFMGYSERLAGYVRGAGFTLELLEPRLSGADITRIMDVDQYRSLRAPFTEEQFEQRVRSEISLIERWQPDAVVVGATLSMFVSARAAGVPLVFARPYSASYGRLTRLSRMRVTKGDGLLGRAVNRALGTVGRTLVTSIGWLPPPWRRVASRYGLTLPRCSFEYLNADLDLLVSLFPALDPPPLAVNEAVAGPVFASIEGELPAEIQALVQRRERPLVYVGMGSSSNRRLALSVLRQLGPLDVEIISPTGGYLTQADRGALPPNVHVYDLLPAHRLAGLIDASITHGGEGTVQTACLSGAPFAGIGLQLEQRANIADCVDYGNALRLTGWDVRRGRVPHVLDRLLSDDTLRRHARELREAAQGLDGPGECSRIIAEFASRWARGLVPPAGRRVMAAPRSQTGASHGRGDR